jgi:hypothetical protein
MIEGVLLCSLVPFPPSPDPLSLRTATTTSLILVSTWLFFASSRTSTRDMPGMVTFADIISAKRRRPWVLIRIKATVAWMDGSPSSSSCATPSERLGSTRSCIAFQRPWAT